MINYRLATVIAAACLGVVTLALADGLRAWLRQAALQPVAPASDASRTDTIAGLLMLLQLESPEARTPAPDFTLPTLDGGRLRLADLRGKVVLLNFWATWCPPCRAEMPAMERIYRELAPRGFTIVAVNYQEKAEVVRPFVEELNLTFPIVLDESGEVTDRHYPLIGLPTTFVLDREGRTVARAVGLREWESAAARALFEALLAESAAGS
jgi:peroxiredoxin